MQPLLFVKHSIFYVSYCSYLQIEHNCPDVGAWVGGNLLGVCIPLGQPGLGDATSASPRTELRSLHAPSTENKKHAN